MEESPRTYADEKKQFEPIRRKSRMDKIKLFIKKKSLFPDSS